jgi:hypothetical protein
MTGADGPAVAVSDGTSGISRDLPTIGIVSRSLKSIMKAPFLRASGPDDKVSADPLAIERQVRKHLSRYELS